jgi:arylsulfatase A-like enzyme
MLFPHSDKGEQMRNRNLCFFLLSIGFLAFISTRDQILAADDKASEPINLLFIMTDQQRFDAMSCAGNDVLETPNMDRLAREGVRFSNAYSNCPVCVPARAVILTGHSIESVGVRSNGEQHREDGPDLPTFDTILLENGYQGEYHGKWHTPYKFALDYSRPVRWLNGKTPPPGCEAEISEASSFVEYIERNVPLVPLEPGQHLANMYKRPYWPDPLDGAYGRTPDEVAEISRDKPSASSQRIGQAYTFGRLEVPPQHSRTAVTAKEGIAGLERLHATGEPFTLTISIGPPHPPLAVPEPFYSMYPVESIPLPASLDDPRTDSPYQDRRTESDLAFRDPANARRMIANYYGLVAEVDSWVGRILDRLDELELSENTLVVFTSDHGEMLCDHGMHSKGVFYESSAHIPMLMRLPGTIPSGQVVETPVSHLDLFPTILDYCGMESCASEGESLRSMIEDPPGDDVDDRIIVSEWASEGVPGFMVFDGRWKLMFGRTANAPSRDALYDLETDPLELVNLLAGANEGRYGPRTLEAIYQAERLKSELVDWLTQIDSPHRAGVATRSSMKTTSR